MIETRVNVGVIGCGVVSDDYFSTLSQFPLLDVIACADLNRVRAEAKAAIYHIPRVCSPAELLADPDIELVVNLTTPSVHAEIGMAAVQAGKSLYTEKPLTVYREEARHLLDLADVQGVLVGCAPDTFLGAPLQTCRKLIDEGRIGQPIAVNANMLTHGPENWHPEPAFYYQPGGGPMFDMGPYYLTALVHLLGPVRRVAGMVKKTYPERIITGRLHHGTKIEVAIPTHISGLLNFASGVIGTLTTSFDVWASEIPAIEIYGTEGTLSIPNPSFFVGPIRLKRAGERTWETVPLLSHLYRDGRGLGIVDLAQALRADCSPRVSGKLAYHVLDIMHAFHDAAQSGEAIDLESSCDCPAPLAL
jgi:Predicted dehydrogenases and related proteins